MAESWEQGCTKAWVTVVPGCLLARAPLADGACVVQFIVLSAVSGGTLLGAYVVAGELPYVHHHAPGHGGLPIPHAVYACISHSSEHPS